MTAAFGETLPVLLRVVAQYGIFAAIGVGCLFSILIAIYHNSTPIAHCPQSFVGQTAEVARDLAPRGKVFFNGSYWNAVSPVPVPTGSKLLIVAVEGMQLRVEPV